MKKTETKRITATKPAEKRTTKTKAEEKTAVKKTAAKKAETKTAAKKPATRKPAAKAVRPLITLQFGEYSIEQETLEQNVSNFLAYDKNIPVSEQTDVHVYVKPEEARAYIVVKGEEQGSILL